MSANNRNNWFARKTILIASVITFEILFLFVLAVFMFTGGVLPASLGFLSLLTPILLPLVVTNPLFIIPVFFLWTVFLAAIPMLIWKWSYVSQVFSGKKELKGPKKFESNGVEVESQELNSLRVENQALRTEIGILREQSASAPAAPAAPAAPPPGTGGLPAGRSGGGRGDLLSQIQAGKGLRKVVGSVNPMEGGEGQGKSSEERPHFTKALTTELARRREISQGKVVAGSANAASEGKGVPPIRRFNLPTRQSNLTTSTEAGQVRSAEGLGSRKRSGPDLVSEDAKKSAGLLDDSIVEEWSTEDPPETPRKLVHPGKLRTESTEAKLNKAQASTTPSASGSGRPEKPKGSAGDKKPAATHSGRGSGSGKGTPVRAVSLRKPEPTRSRVPVSADSRNGYRPFGANRAAGQDKSGTSHGGSPGDAVLNEFQKKQRELSKKRENRGAEAVKLLK